MFAFDASRYPYPSKRNLVYGKRGMVATSNPMATEAGLAVMRRGGNAIDAAVAAAAALGVVDAGATGPGGDLFAIVYSGGKLHGLNSSGPSGALFSREEMLKRGHDKVPATGWMPVTVSGGPAGWAALVKRFGRLSLSDVMAPAVELAKECVATQSYAQGVNSYSKRLLETDDPIYEPWFDHFMPGKVPLRAGQVVRVPELARTLELIGATDAEAFYRGELARAFAAYSEKTGGLLRYEDFAAYQPEWVDPVAVGYRGYDIWELPPNGQGIVASMALNILEGFDPVSHDDALTVHRQIEAIKLGFADAIAYIADPNHLTVKVEDLLSKGYADKRRALIGDRAIQAPVGEPGPGHTVYLNAADDRGNMISLIQSVAANFGSGMVVPGTGVLMQNRGSGFSMEEGHPNVAAPRKRSFHTIIPGFITKDGEAIGPIGVMGGHMQPQGHVQVIMNMLDFGMNPQAALDAPRWHFVKDKQVCLEGAWPQNVIEALRARGHDIDSPGSAYYGRGQIILRLPDGTLCGGTEPRSDGSVMGY